MTHRFLIVILFIIASMTGEGKATELPKPIFNVTTPEPKELIVENVYAYKVMKYDPPVKVKLFNNPSDASYETPEQTLISHFSAMFALDYSWFLNGWSKESLKIMEETNKKNNRPPEFWRQKWAEGFKNRCVEFIHRIETGDYVLIEYKLYYHTGEQGEFLNTVVLKFENGRWVLTNELATDPVPVYWKTPEQRLKKIIR